MMYSMGHGVPADETAAMAWYEAAAAQRHPAASHNLGLKYYQARGAAKDVDTALRLFHQSAELGLAESQYLLGHLYLTGEEIPGDLAQVACIGRGWRPRKAIQGDRSISVLCMRAAKA